jgi:hypothetical protein
LYFDFDGTTIASDSDHRRDRRRLVELDLRLVGLDRAEHHEPGHHQLVGVARRLRDELREPERAAGAVDVEDLDAVVELGVARGGLERAGGRVPAAAGSRRGHDLQLAVGIGLCLVVAGLPSGRGDRHDRGHGEQRADHHPQASPPHGSGFFPYDGRQNRVVGREVL